MLFRANGKSKAVIQDFIATNFLYDLNQHVDQIRRSYKFDVYCQGTVPQTIRVFLDSSDFEDASRTAVALGADTVTLACIAGGIAQAFFGEVPEAIAIRVYEILDAFIGKIMRDFMDKCEGQIGPNPFSAKPQAQFLPV